MTNDEISMNWEDRLRSSIRSTRAVSAVVPLVEHVVSRRRVRRRLLSAAGAATAAAIVAVSVGLLGNAPTTAARPGPVAPLSVPATADFACDNSGFGDATIDELEQQQDIAAAALLVDDERFTVLRAEPSALGVVAVVSGDVDAAREALPAVQMIVADIPELAEIGDTIMGVQSLLKPVSQQIHRAIGEDPGFLQTAFWNEAGAVVVAYKAPIPETVEALAGTRPNGVQVLIQPTRYGGADLDRASLTLMNAADLKVTVVSQCSDGSGLKVGVESLEGDDKAVVAANLSERVGIPVEVSVGSYARF